MENFNHMDIWKVTFYFTRSNPRIKSEATFYTNMNGKQNKSIVDVMQM
jgi:hypothetical protein